jgi:apolipoprotein N-acyltransferase
MDARPDTAFDRLVDRGTQLSRALSTNVAGVRHWRRAALAGGAGALSALGTPPTNSSLAPVFGLAVWVALLDLGGDSRTRTGASRPWSGALRGFAFGVGINLLSLRFVPEVVARFTPLPWAAGVLALVFAAMLQALPFAVTGVLTRLMTRLTVPFPAAFAFAMFAATFVPVVFPWTMASALTHHPVLAQTADLWGERGVCFGLALVVSCITHAIVARKPPVMVLGALLAAVAIRYGISRQRVQAALRAEAPSVEVGLVDPHTEAHDRWDHAKHPRIVANLHALTREAESAGVALTIWPEAAYPYTLGHRASRDAAGASAIIGPGLRGPIIAGLIMRDMNHTYNSAVLADSLGMLSKPYDKIVLLPFGEHLPLSDELPFLQRLFVRDAPLAPGAANVLLVTDVGAAEPLRAGVLNCFEDTLTESARTASVEASGARANLLVNITNDAWFDGSGESALHMHLARFRAIETRLDFVRAVNRGPLGHISSTGEVEAVAQRGEGHVLIVRPRLLSHAPTLYQRFGQAPLSIAFVLCVAYSVFRVMRARRGLATGAGV